jgi:adenine-specific DNA methylase
METALYPAATRGVDDLHRSGGLGEAHEQALADARAAGCPSGPRLADGGIGAEAYADAVATYLGFAISRLADRHSSLTRWDPNPTGYAPKIAKYVLSSGIANGLGSH